MEDKFNIILADPAWLYTDGCHAGKRGAVYKYPCMSLEDIKNLPVANLAADNAFLFLWATWPLLKEALEVIPAWGFEYKTIGFLWVKTNKVQTDTLFWGMGNHTRSNTEPCLLAVKGKPKRISAGVHSVIMSPIEQHSKKPDIVRDKIVELCGDLPRLELFCRFPASGWKSWGNEIESDIEL